MARKKWLNPSCLPGSFESRVFVGGSYKASAIASPASRQLLDRLKKVVLAEGLDPIIADEFAVSDRDRNIHHDAIYLLHACRLGIFELSEFSGAMMEIERSADYATRSIVLHHDPKSRGWRLSWMLSSFVLEHNDRMRLYGYIDEPDAMNAARNWLKEMLRLKYAGK